MKKWMRALGAALGGAVLCSAPALAGIKVGETSRFTMDDTDKISTVNALLDAKLGHDVMATGGTIKRVAASRFLLCGYYADQSRPGAVPGFAILHDPTINLLRVSAPLTMAEQEKRGCWPDERARVNASVADVLRKAKASSSMVTTTSP